MNVTVHRSIRYLFVASIATILTACPSKKERRDDPQTILNSSGAPQRKPNWAQLLAYQALPSFATRGQDYCSIQLAFDPRRSRLYRVDASRLVDLHYPDQEPLPPGYSNVWHDNCPARVFSSGLHSEPDDALESYSRPKGALVRRFFKESGSMYWLSEHGKECVRVEIAPLSLPVQREPRVPEHSNPSLEAFASIAVARDALWRLLIPHGDWSHAIPAAIQLPSHGRLGFIFMGTWIDESGKPVFKCQCERLLRIMRLDKDVVHMLPRRLPNDIKPDSATIKQVPTYRDEVEYYDPSEVERWFWEKKECEEARLTSLRRIKDDGRLTTRSGFYSGYAQLE